MNKFTITMLAAAAMLLCTTANSNAGVHFGVYVGGPGYYYYPSAPYEGYNYYNGYGHYPYRRHTRYWHH